MPGTVPLKFREYISLIFNNVCANQDSIFRHLTPKSNIRITTFTYLYVKLVVLLQRYFKKNENFYFLSLMVKLTC